LLLLPQIGYRHVDFRKLQPSMVLFNLRSFVGRYVAGPGEPGKDATQLLADIGACLGTEIFGSEIFRALSGSSSLTALLALPNNTRSQATGRTGRFALERLNRLAEAQSELEDILAIFEEAGDHSMKGKVLSSLASVFFAKGDPRHAAIQARRALVPK